MKNKLIIIIFNILLTLLLLEGGLRILGRTPHAGPGSSDKNYMQIVNEIGWKLVPGNWDKKGMPHTILEGGHRATANKQVQTNPVTVYVVGDSFSFGIGLKDSETFAWILQSQLGNFNFANYAVPAYGSCQTFLKMKKIIEEKPGEKLFIYGFPPFHADRNIGDARILWNLANSANDRTLYLPICKMEAGELVVENQKFQINSFLGFFIDRSALASTLVAFYYQLSHSVGKDDKIERTKAIILAMNKLARENNSKLVLLTMWHESSDPYKQFLRDNQIEVVNGFHQDQFAKEMLLYDDQHPSAKMHSYWASLLLKYFKSDP